MSTRYFPPAVISVHASRRRSGSPAKHAFRHLAFARTLLMGIALCVSLSGCGVFCGFGGGSGGFGGNCGIGMHF